MQDTGFTWADILDEASVRAGGQTMTAAEVLSMQRSFRILMERWQAQGYPSWRIERGEALLDGRSPQIRLPGDVDDVIHANSVVTATGSEATMRRITASEYTQITRKFTEGRPSQYYLDRADPPSLFVFPMGTPNQQGKVVFTYVKRPDAFEAYEYSSDIPGRWIEALIVNMATELAKKRPPVDMGLIQMLTADANAAEDRAQRADRDRSRYRVRMPMGSR